MDVDFSGARVLVVGDAILDVYAEGHVSRISPEAPVPVVRLESERVVPGGAANVAANVASLGGEADLVTVLGEDGPGATLRAILAGWRHAASPDGAIVCHGRPTTTKTRVMGNGHQIVRLDREESSPIPAATEAAILAAVADRIGGCDVLILSDYAKGVCTDGLVRGVIALARAAGRPLLVDPKRTDFSVYAGATYIKPNRRELALASGVPCETDVEVEHAAARIMAQTAARLLVTRSEQGMSFFGPDAPAMHVPTIAREVFDVSGAGDTVLAAFALGLCRGLPMPQILAMANACAAVVVGKTGTATVTAGELAREAARQRAAVEGYEQRVAGLAEARALRLAWRAEGQVVGFTNGCFDLLHPGHISLLRQAAAACDRLIVGLNGDASVRRLKGPSRPVQPVAARAEVIAAIGCVDLVVVFDEDTPARIIEVLRPDVLVKGADYTVETVVGADTVIGGGGRVILADLVAGQSTTDIIRRAGR
jgi:D-beta-D-heptose 7-phosphate kinase/D-beta-D-heptose 1-phosphate adenosyltransferase